MPKLGQAMTEGTIVEWHFADGESVEKGAVLLTAETDKATYELEATASGVLQILAAAGDEVAVDTVIGQIGGAPAASATEKASAPPPQSTPLSRSSAEASKPARVLASPKAKRLAAEHGIDLADVTASAADGVISAADVEAAVTAMTTAASPAAEPLSGARKTIARRVQQAWQTIPHIVQMVEVDASALRTARAALSAEHSDLSLNDLLLHTAARVIGGLPELNVRITDEGLVAHAQVDVGFAVDGPRGLMVPVIRRAESLSVAELVAERQRLVKAVQAGRLDSADTGDASFTVSNLGMFGISFGTPIINPGESCLVFVGAVEDRAVVVDGAIVARPMMTLSIAYDHRVADGVAASRFSRGLKEALEQGIADAGGRSDEPGTAAATRVVRTASTGSGYRVDASSRGHAWTLDEPHALDGTDQGPDPVTALLGALLSCMTITFKIIAARKGIPIEAIDGVVRGNPEGRLSEVKLELVVRSPAPEAELRALLVRAERGCYVSRALSDEIALSVELEVA